MNERSNIPGRSRSAQALISCIVPVFNGERFLGEALDSIFAQTWRPIEVIVVDDGSTDRTKQVVARYSERLTCFRQQNAGPAAARNKGLDLAGGEFIAFLDADDLWHPEKLARQMACFSARPEIGMCITHIENFWEKGREEEAQRLSAQNHPYAREHIGFVCPVLLVRRGVFDKVGGFDASLWQGEDTDWFARTDEQGIAREVLPEVLVYRRMHSANLTLACTKEDRLKIVIAKLQRQRFKHDARK
ncbi:MAG: glycosyltransferase family 2 protein [Gammaproteobacteria bacterium]|nr:glycosyltransferase family 2 protein [Gammaproteobacteria bacterium]